MRNTVVLQVDVIKEKVRSSQYVMYMLEIMQEDESQIWEFDNFLLHRILSKTIIQKIFSLFHYLVIILDSQFE